MADEIRIGRVSHYYGKLHVAAIELTDGDLSVGDTIHVTGHTSDFVQKIQSMEVEHGSVTHADRGQSIGIRVLEHAREHDAVYKVLN